MLITTRYGEMPSDADYGCAIWDLQFEIVVDPMRWKHTVEQSIHAGIIRYERRLEQVVVQVNLQDVELTYPYKQYPEIKKQATVFVSARLKHSQENYSFSTKVFVSPLAN